MLDDYALTDRYTRQSGRVFLTGTQALVRLPLMQAALDRAAGLNTAGLISGYRGSPLGAYDQELWRAQDLLDDANVRFMPAVNEDLGATALLGSQQVESDPHREVDGVFGIWYGKGPGVDRSGDALKHGNAYGSSPHGGVLVVAGDDHGAVSSSMPHQSDVAFLTFFMPHLSPANVAEYLSFGLWGIALSRFSGSWVGFKAVSETLESAQSVVLPELPRFVIPEDFEPPPGGLHYRWPDLPGPEIEERLLAKKAAALAFAEANPIDRRIFDVPDARYGIVTTGKAHLDLMEALRMLGIDRAEARRIGLDVYKVGMVWPLAHESALDFVRGKREVLVVEEKRGIIESWFKENFYDYPGRKPERMVGKADENGRELIPWVGELTPLQLVAKVAARIDAVLPGLDLTARARALAERPLNIVNVEGATRTPYFCSGCPHNTSTRVPEGSSALAGIGCHFMASWMERDTESLIQMGGEGVNWVGRSMFNGGRHIFQNLGEGTFYHSGSLAIRQAVAAGTNITYKILYNDAVAMTGGQPVDGPISVQGVANAVRAEGVERIALVSDTPGKLALRDFPEGMTLHERDELDAVQRELRDLPGVTVLIYEQTCAAEKRRRRKHGRLDEPSRRVVINEQVCEGCGDCSVASNCLSVVPRETWLGRKRQIDQNSCNKDFSCLDGFCPSFVTIEGGERRKPERTVAALNFGELPQPELPALQGPYDLLVTGVGGTGVVTVGALITMAAHLEGKGASVLDFMGFSQKFGPVLSYIRLGEHPDELNQVRIDRQRADAVIGCDLVVTSSPRASSTFNVQRTRAVLNSAEMATGDFVLHRDAALRPEQRVAGVQQAVQHLDVVDANRAAEHHLGDTIYANVLMLGFAWQQGLVPVGYAALNRALELNGVAVPENRQAFELGRALAAGKVQPMAETPPPTEADLPGRRRAFLTAYQNAALADRFEAMVAEARDVERRIDPASTALSDSVGRAYFKLLTYKDEYEVARLHSDPAFRKQIESQFTGSYRLAFHLAPPLLARKQDARGRPKKIRFGGWMMTVFALLARLKFLRGTAFDPFRLTADRRTERALIEEFEDLCQTLFAELGPQADRAQLVAAAELVALVHEVRGYGPVKEAAAATWREARDRALEEWRAAGLARAA